MRMTKHSNTWTAQQNKMKMNKKGMEATVLWIVLTTALVFVICWILATRLFKMGG